ncbi:MAG: redox-regulated ATPase YchF [Bacteroidetes bacterium]|nr:redox-regulated ATPase YchF [Bacteroidota bacterium]
MQIGIVGLPFSGKTTLFQTITKTHLDASAVTTLEAHHAVVKVPDERLTRCAELLVPRRTTYATIEFVDVVGLQRNERGSPQFTTHFLANVKSNDALIHVVRVFKNETVPHPEGTIDPVRDITLLETEFILADLALLESRIEKITKTLLKTKNEQMARELFLLEKCKHHLEHEQPLRNTTLTPEEHSMLKPYQLLTTKPMLIALNFDEMNLDNQKILSEIRKQKESPSTKVIHCLGKLEFEMSELPDEEAALFMQEYGITESTLDLLIRESYRILGLQSFFTVGEDECRAWTIKKGMTAQEAAGVIHSDFYTKFIRAEVVHYDDFIAAGGSFAKARELGLWRLEGKDYVVQDGDILSIRHS